MADGLSISRRKARWGAFLADGAEPGFLFHVNYADPEYPEPAGCHKWPAKASERVEWAKRRYEVQVAKSRFVGDDRVPYLSLNTGTEIFAEAFGCRVVRPEDTMPFALPLVKTAAEAETLAVPELSSSSLAYLFDLADALAAFGGPEAVLGMVDIQSPMDIAALIWEKSSFFTAMIESPEAVKALAAKVRVLLCAFLDEWFGRYGTEYIAHYPDYLMNGGMTLSEDEIGAVSGEMFRQFFRDELELLSKRYGGIGIHCCADARHQWENLRAIPGLRLLNLVNPPIRTPEEYTARAYEYFGNACAQMHFGWTPYGAGETWPGQYPSGCRVVFECQAGNRDEARALADRLAEIRGSD